nr:MAG TPA: cytochrome c-552 [Caudoviricetes sp.]
MCSDVWFSLRWQRYGKVFFSTCHFCHKRSRIFLKSGNVLIMYCL